MKSTTPLAAMILATMISATMILPVSSVSSLAADIKAPHKPDLVVGGHLAARWCGECHAIPGSEGAVNTDVLSFVAIARKDTLDAESLAHFLMNPHPVMPDMQITHTEAADLAAYITSLKTDDLPQ